MAEKVGVLKNPNYKDDLRLGVSAGMKFNRLTVVCEVERKHPKIPLFLCRCDCGNETKVNKYHLISWHTSSCGCRQKQYAAKRLNSHGKLETPTYRSWYAMLTRCTNKNTKSYHHYGGRGITICDKWMSSFENFLHDMGERPLKKSLDRIDVNGNYEPDNCRWATALEQARNTRAVRILHFNGISKCVTEWAEIIGISPKVIYSRLQNGIAIEEVLHKTS